MFAKIFESIYDGTLADNWQAMVTFQQILILSDAEGVVDMSPSAISRRTGIPLEIIKAGLDVLSQPDNASRSPAMQGRRIVLLDAHRDWGWFIVNHAEYRKRITMDEKREKDRQRIAGKRAENRISSALIEDQHEVSQGVAGCSALSQEVAEVAHTDTDTDTDTERALPSEPNGSDSSPPLADDHSDDAAKAAAAKAKAEAKAQRLYEVTDEASEAYNAICAKPNGLMPMATKPGRQTRQANIRRVLATASLICDEQYGDRRITRQFWDDYFGAVQADEHKSGRMGGGRGHENWVPDFEYLTRKDTMVDVFERAVTEAQA